MLPVCNAHSSQRRERWQRALAVTKQPVVVVVKAARPTRLQQADDNASVNVDMATSSRPSLELCAVVSSPQRFMVEGLSK